MASISRAIDRAVKVATARHNITVDTPTLVDRWEIIGRRLRNAQNLDDAFKFANDVTKAVNIPGLKITPIVTRIGRDTWVGFIDRGRLPKNLG